jgi:hypothetical protein
MEVGQGPNWGCSAKEIYYHYYYYYYYYYHCCYYYCCYYCQSNAFSSINTSYENRV